MLEEFLASHGKDLFGLVVAFLSGFCLAKGLAKRTVNTQAHDERLKRLRAKRSWDA